MECGTLTGRRAAQGLSDAAQIDYNSLNAVAFPFDLGLKALHLVTIEGVCDIL